MDKAEALKKVKEKGYEADLIDSVLMFFKCGDKPSYEEVAKLVKEIGYDSSYGLSVKRHSLHIAPDERLENKVAV